MNKTQTYPFIIWTLQRTGGTNLATRLFKLAPFSSVGHEPFNIDREYGDIVKHWTQHKDKTALDEAITEICAQNILIKHCVENVPWEINEALARASMSANYRHIFLYRRDAADRLLSLHYAQVSGCWGRDMELFKEITGLKEANVEVALPAEDDSTVLQQPVPIENLLAHEQRCVETLNLIWHALTKLDAQPMAIAYEDIYAAQDKNQPTRQLSSVLNYLGLTQSESKDNTWMNSVITKGEQGTRDKYYLFPGAKELRKRCGFLPIFAPNPIPLVARALVQNHPWILACFVDVWPTTVAKNQTFTLGGVVVLSNEAPLDTQLILRGTEKEFPVLWGQPSQLMAKKYPAGLNANIARFVIEEAEFEDAATALTLVLKTAQDNDLVLAEILQALPLNLTQIHIAHEDRLIFDIGANDGSDTTYYLRKGFRVVAVEAIPALAEALQKRLALQIQSARLVLEPIAITADSKGAVITVNEDWTEWSSVHGAPMANQGRSNTINVPSATLASLIQEYGKPYYCKIDIEGGELDAIQSLSECSRDRLPTYLSFELSPQWGQVLEQLYALGYRRFQLIRQGADFLPLPPVPSREGLDFRPVWSSSVSGPFGRDLPETHWVGLVEIIKKTLDAAQDIAAKRSKGETPSWFDIHAVIK